ncbi:MAG: sigma-70 family RNA polymerase sigma factor [Bacteroidetes bacterium]|nr:sigma-70 family RNA polymerase sigma factor [Bacteroidota bacterium]
MPFPTDPELINYLRDPERLNEGFRLLLQKYQQRIYWQIRRMVLSHEDTDDIVQNVFLKVFKHIHNFREDSSLFTWIYRITVNETLNFLKTKRRYTFFSFDSMSHQLNEQLAENQHFTGSQIQQKLQKAILSLPDKQRLVFNMKYFDENLTFEDLSAILDTSVGGLKASYHHAVKKIEKRMKEE